MSGALQALNTGTRVIQGVGALAGGAGRLLTDLGVLGPGSGGLVGFDLGADGGGASWLDQLQPASFRGVPFLVLESRRRYGRRTAVHEYPFRDVVWVEDLGLGVESLSFRAFVVGDDCYGQRDALAAAMSARGSGTLVHPSLGSITVAARPAEETEAAADGRMVGFALEFLRTGLSIYPSAALNTPDQVGIGQAGLLTAAAGDFGSQVLSGVQQGAAAVQAGVRTVGAWAAQAQRLVGDAALVTHAVTGLAGNFGRYGSGTRTGGAGGLLQGISTAEGALSAVTRARTAVGSACAGLAGLAGAL